MQSNLKEIPCLVNEYSYLPSTKEKLARLELELSNSKSSDTHIHILDEIVFHNVVQNNLAKAKDFALKQLKAALSLKHVAWKMRSLRRLSWVTYQASDHKKAIQYINRAYKLQKSLASECQEALREKAAVVRFQGSLFSVVKGDSKRAIHEQFNALQISKEIDDEYGIAESQYKIGEAYVNLGLVVPALEYFDKSLQYYTRVANPMRISSINGRIGQIYLTVGEPDVALTYLNRAADSAPNEFERIDNSRLLGLAYRDRGEYDRALELHEEFGQFYSSDPFWFAFSLMDKGRVFLANEEPEQALHCIEQAEKIFKAEEQALMVNEVTLDKGRAFLQRKEWKKAIYVFQQALDSANNLGMVYLKTLCLMYLAQAYEETGQLELSIHHYKSFLQAERKVLSTEVRLIVSQYHMRSSLQAIESEGIEDKQRKEQIERDIGMRSQAITTSSLQITQYNNLLHKLREELVKVIDSGEIDSGMVKKMIREIDNRDQYADLWNKFSQQLQKLDQKFLRRIALDYPKLTPAEIRVCCLLRVGISNKEIASLLNLSSRTIDAHRRSIRRKLNITQGQSLERKLDKLGSISGAF